MDKHAYLISWTAFGHIFIRRKLRAGSWFTHETTWSQELFPFLLNMAYAYTYDTFSVNMEFLSLSFYFSLRCLKSSSFSAWWSVAEQTIDTNYIYTLNEKNML